ncbi:MAG: FAD/NAD(P)-binding protein [Chloroflexi bacterium]|nr:FAD/NAD(P)-binding protein [Chloroflexota bacterium]
MENPLQPLSARIEAVRRENADTFTMDFALKNGYARRRYSFVPGQFNMLSLMGFEEAPISLASAPSADGRFQHTVKAVGRLTQALRGFKEGDTVGVRGPYGEPWPVGELKGKNLLAVAGGIGLAPLRSLLLHVFQHRAEYGKVTLLYGAKTPGEIVYGDELEGWGAQPETMVGLTVDRIDGRPWKYNVGVVPTLFEKVPVSAANCLALVCGPEVMLKFVLLDLFKRGFPPERIFVSMERRMRCGIAQCGHCMFGPKFVCREGPVFRFDSIQHLLGKGV